jgi:UDP-glucose 4-epimerase
VRAIVTGGAGFIGSHLVEALLARGDEVLVVDDLSRGKREHVPPEAEFVARNIREPLGDVFGDYGPEVCFHLAAQADVRVSVARPVDDATINVLGTLRALEASQEHGAKLVFSSSGGAIYGECARPAREDDPLQPISPYGTAKLAAEMYIETWNRLYDANHVSLRYANVYGPRQEAGLEGGVVAIFFERLDAGDPVTIFGDGRQTRDFVHVADIVGATLAAVDAAGVYNVGSGVETSVLELFELCREIALSDVGPELADERLGEIRRSVLDPSRIEMALAWRAGLDLREGLQLTWDATQD